MSKPTENPNTKTGNPMRNEPNRNDPNRNDPKGERKDFRETGQEADPESAQEDIKAPGKDHMTDPGQR